MVLVRSSRKTKVLDMVPAGENLGVGYRTEADELLRDTHPLLSIHPPQGPSPAA